MAKRMAIIVNPKAGTNLQNIESAVETHLNQKRFNTACGCRSIQAMDLNLLKAVDEGYDIVVAVGGDGLSMKLHPALIGTEVALELYQPDQVMAFDDL